MRRVWSWILMIVMISGMTGCAAQSTRQDLEADTQAGQTQAQQELQPTKPEADTDAEEPAGVPDDLAERAEEVEDDFLRGEWVQDAPDGAMRVSVDADGEMIVLYTQQALNAVWISRVAYDEQAQDYVRTERLWWMNEWDTQTPLLLVMDAPTDEATLELSWEDAFGERERRLIVPTRIFRDGTAEEAVQLLYFAVPIVETELTAQTPIHLDLDLDGQKETVTFSVRAADESGAPQTLLHVQQRDAIYEQQLTLLDTRCWVADLDDDQEAEIYLSGTTLSGAKRTYGWRLNQAGLTEMVLAQALQVQDEDGRTAARGCITAVEDGLVTVTDTVELLGGSYTGQVLLYARCGTLDLLDGVWTLERGAALELRVALPVTLADGTQATLGAGTQLYLTATDCESMADFETAEGVRGTLELRRSGDAWLVEGLHSGDVFA